MGASLATGYVENGAVTCPWHAWRFCVKEGTWLDNPRAKIKQDCYEVRVVDNEIQVRPAEAPPASE
jgi:nitrite reductase (NADH) small subunit/3-phenylpropionate/trans-cinnamate dioxygenase ferredoxin subunit